jgi:hypothetical protein
MAAVTGTSAAQGVSASSKTPFSISCSLTPDIANRHILGHLAPLRFDFRKYYAAFRGFVPPVRQTWFPEYL